MVSMTKMFTTRVPTPKARETTKPKIHPCDWAGCRASFGRNADMVRHRKTVHQHIRQHRCSHCNKAFSQQASLKTHIRTHTREKPYECEFHKCHKAFGDQSSCSRHFRDIHSGLTHFCPWCSSANKRGGEFRKHLSKMHNVEDSKMLDITCYQLPDTLTVDDLERLPEFAGLPGIEMRRKMPGRNRGRHVAQPPPSADMLQNPGLIQMTRTSSMESFASTPTLSPAPSSTPALSLASVSPSPPLEDLRGDFYSASGMSQPSYGGNDLQIHFGAESQDAYLSPLSFAGSHDLTQVNEGMGSYVQHGYYAMHDDQAQPSGCVKPFVDGQTDHAPAFVGNDMYEHHGTTFQMLPAQNQVFPAGWQPEYTAPISRLGRLSHGQAPVAWGQLQ